MKKSNTSIIQKTVLSTVTLVALLGYQPANAVWWATEGTQIANNVLLGGQLAQQILQLKTQIDQYNTMIQNLMALPQDVMDSTLGPVQDVLDDVRGLQDALVGLQGSVEEVGTTWQRRSKEMINIAKDPKTYFKNKYNMANAKGENYKKQWDADIAASEALAKRITEVQKLAGKIKNVEGNVQGLQLLNTQLNVVATSLNDMVSIYRKQSVNELQKEMDTQDEKMQYSKVKEKQNDASTDEINRSKNASFGFKAPWEK